jgi:hypothetical protein
MRARCRRCRAAFEAQRISAIYCSDKCRLASWRKTRRAIARSEVYSPPEVVAAARALFNTIDLDPASCPTANEVVMASRYYSFREDGLTQPWFGRIWANPPYPWAPWVPKLLAEWHGGNVAAIVALATTRVTTAKYFAPLVSASSAILKMDGRIQFWGPRAVSPPEGHELYYFGDDVAGFERHFTHFGKIFRPTA